MRFYLIRNSYFAQIEGCALISLRIGYTCVGIACLGMLMLSKSRQKWWHRFLPLVDLAVLSHTGQCDQRWLFRLQLFGSRRKLGYVTSGDADPAKHDRYYDSGPYVFTRYSLRRRRFEARFKPA